MRFVYPDCWSQRIPPLADYIDYLGYRERNAGDLYRSRALPRGAATIIIDFYAADGCIRLDLLPAFNAGAGIASYVTFIDAAHSV